MRSHSTGGTGLRGGECAGLCWDAVDLHAVTVRVLRVAEEVSGHVRLKPYPKSKAGSGTVRRVCSTTLNLYTHSTRERDPRVLGALDAFSLPPAEEGSPEEAEDPSEEGP